MLKTQRFSSLFRHYAKYHGLRKDDLEYYFVNPLENEDTPESVQLQRGDTIMVRKRRKAEPPEVAADDDEFFRDMRELLDDEEHMEAVFLVHSEVQSDDNSKMDSDENLVEIRAHKCILTARTDYFKALFRKGATLASGKNSGVAFRESEECTITVEPMFGPVHVRYMLEFIYTNRIVSIRSISTEDLLSLLHLSDKWLLRDLKRLVEHELVRNHMSVHTVARMYGATEDFNAQRLSRACIDYIMTNLKQVTSNATFEEEMKNYPHLCIPILKAAADMIPEGPVHKKQRTDHGTNATSTSATPSSVAAAAAAGLGSSPVPDSDP
jgi:speckle-type POZ protein